MKSSIIKIGNSQGVRLPKHLLDQTKISTKVEITPQNGGLFIKPIREEKNETMELSESALNEWNSEKEDRTWAHLQ